MNTNKIIIQKTMATTCQELKILEHYSKSEILKALKGVVCDRPLFLGVRKNDFTQSKVHRLNAVVSFFLNYKLSGGKN